MTRILAWLFVALFALVLASIAVALVSPSPDARETAQLRLQVDSLTADLELARGSFNALFARFGEVEQRCVFRKRRSSTITR